MFFFLFSFVNFFLYKVDFFFLHSSNNTFRNKWNKKRGEKDENRKKTKKAQRRDWWSPMHCDETLTRFLPVFLSFCTMCILTGCFAFYRSSAYRKRNQCHHHRDAVKVWGRMKDTEHLIVNQRLEQEKHWTWNFILWQATTINCDHFREARLNF